MNIRYLHIRNFKSIRDMEIEDIENALILVGRNSAGKTVVLDAIRLIGESYVPSPDDFNEEGENIEITVNVEFSGEDMDMLHEQGIVSKYRRRDLWEKEFAARLPSFKDGQLFFEMSVNKNGSIRYTDGIRKNNPYIPLVFPKLYYIDSSRHFEQIQKDMLLFQEEEPMDRLRGGRCVFDPARTCQKCFNCIGVIGKKTPEELNVLEAARLFEYKLYQGKLTRFTEKVNECFHKNGGHANTIYYYMDTDMDTVCHIRGFAKNNERGMYMPLEKMGNGMRSIYILSLLEAYVYGSHPMPCIILLEDPEIFLHPRLQKVAGEILYRLSKKNQIIFSTHSPNMLFNFTSGQIRQIRLDKDNYSVAVKQPDIDRILDDLGYTANDLMNVSFVFIVEGKQDKSRLPLLLDKYYSEIRDENGDLSRIAIITTNSCTNIKTYANLKYINKLYLKDQFLMIRDGDGLDPEALAGQLCRYYDERNAQDVDRLPKVTRRNVLILKYYSFENYFLDPAVMTAIGVIEGEEQFYDILFEKWNEYLRRLRCGQTFLEKTGAKIHSPGDLKKYMESFKIYMRGHNLYDIFYGRYKKNETEILKAYIDAAPRDAFKDILDAIDHFIYFDSRKI